MRYVVPLRVLLYLAQYLFSGAIAVYFVDEVLKYRLKHLKMLYIISLVVGLILGIVLGTVDHNIFGDEVIFTDVIQTVNILIQFILLVINLKEKIWKRVILLFFALDILFSFNVMFTSLSSNLWNYIPDNLNISPKELIGVLFAMFILAITGLEFLFFRILAKVRKKNDNKPLPIPIVIAFSIIMTLLVNTTSEEILSEENSTNTLLTSILLLMSLAGIVAFFYVRSIRNERSDLKELNSVKEDLINEQTKYFEASAKADNDIRSMRHDMRNNTQVLLLLLENKEYDKMRDFLNEMGENLSSTNISSHTGNTIADAIIADKKNRASDKGLVLKTSGVITDVDFSPVDICKILSNLLDNAIEAASSDALKELDADLKTIDLQFKKTDTFFMITCSNPCDHCPEIENGRIVTTKKDKKSHGFGLNNIETASANYDGEMSITCEKKPYGSVVFTEIIFPIS